MDDKALDALHDMQIKLDDLMTWTIQNDSNAYSSVMDINLKLVEVKKAIWKKINEDADADKQYDEYYDNELQKGI